MTRIVLFLSQAGRIAALAVVLSAFPGCDSSAPNSEDGLSRQVEGAPDVWLLTIDTVRADHLGCWGHPNGHSPTLDRLMRQGLIARHAFTPSPLTAPSHASILTGLEPPRHGVRDNGKYALDNAIPTLATLLGEHEFSTGGFVAAFPLESRFGFGQGFDVYDDELRESAASARHYAQRSASEIRAAATAWLQSLPSDERWFLWTHFFDPHQPMEPPAPFNRAPGLSNYGREIKAMDYQIRRLLQDVLSLGGGRLPVIALASDHGEALGDHREISHGILIQEPTVRGVLGFTAPPGTAEHDRLTSGITEDLARHSDLLPTLFDILDLPLEETVDGRSLASRPTASEDALGAYSETWYAAFHHGWSPLLSWRDERWTYIEGPNPELFDRYIDPGELENVLEANPEVASDFAAYIKSVAREPEDPTVELDAEAEAKLAALGYVSSVGGGFDFDRTKDPKELIQSINDLFRGITLLGNGRTQLALHYLQQSYEADSTSGTTTFYLANAMRESGRRQAAMDYYRRTIELMPDAAEAYAHLSILELDSGRKEEASLLLEAGLAINPESFPLQMTAGDLFQDEGQLDRAAEHYLAAAEAEPFRFEPWVQWAKLERQRGNFEAAARYEARAQELRTPRRP